MTFLVKGRKVLDTRTSTTAWSANPALIVRDWLTSDWGYEVTRPTSTPLPATPRPTPATCSSA